MAVCLLIHKTISIGPERIKNEWVEFLRGHKMISQTNSRMAERIVCVFEKTKRPALNTFK